jgi:ATP-dependent DNA helicase DinG
VSETAGPALPVPDLLAEKAAAALAAGGPLSRHLPGFRPRSVQQAMARRVAEALAARTILIAESGTGTGKTFAYLVPALLSGLKVLVSTGTRHLQDQLFHRDLPMVRAALGRPVTVALLKGRANYLCLYRLERHTAPGLGLEAQAVAPLEAVRRFAAATRSGDLAEAQGLPEDAPIWPLVTSTADNCLGSRCPHYEVCFVNRARRTALAADVVVVNHHLFFADLALREEGFGQLLPGVEAVIFDEAHQLPEIAAQFFGVSLSSHQLVLLARDVLAEAREEKRVAAGLAEAVRRLEQAVARVRAALTGAGRTAAGEARREDWARVADDATLREALDALDAALAGLDQALIPAATQSEGLANAQRRAADLAERLAFFRSTPSDYVAWFEAGARGFSLHLTPLTLAATFRAHTQARKAWIFTSATLAVGGRFEHFQSQLGLEAAETALWPSPYDFSRQALLYLPEGLPEPSAADYTERMLEAVLPVLEASRGRAFVLFTSHRALARAAAWLAGRLDYPLLVQGEAPRAELLARFRALGNAVLLGTGSFWEGVDVRGEALSCVIIDKLPFAVPDDPVRRARLERLAEAGGNAFLEVQLPEAVIALKQGAGRLIRDETDRGVLVLCDPRLLTRGYGRVFLESLPPMPRTRRLEDVQAFFRAAASDNSPRPHGEGIASLSRSD